MSNTGTKTQSKAKAAEKKGNFVEVEFLDEKFAGPQSFRVYTDSKGKKREYIDINGNESTFGVTINPPGRTFDLNNPVDKHEWDFFKDYPLDSLRPGVLRIRNLAKEAEEFVSQSKKVTMLQAKLYEMKTPELNRFARLFGINPQLNSDDAVLQKMIEKTMVKETFDLIVDMFESDDRPFLEAVKAGVESQTITTEKGIYKYEEFTLGHSESQAAKTLKENPDLFNTISKQVK